MLLRRHEHTYIEAATRMMAWKKHKLNPIVAFEILQRPCCTRRTFLGKEEEDRFHIIYNIQEHGIDGRLLFLLAHMYPLVLSETM